LAKKLFFWEKVGLKTNNLGRGGIYFLLFIMQLLS